MAGHIQDRGNGSYLLSVSLGYKDGKQQRATKTIHATSRREAEKCLAKFFVEQQRMLGVDRGMTFRDFVDKIFKKRHLNELSLICQVHYEGMLNRRILPAFGDLKLHKVDESCVLNFVNYLRAGGARLDNQDKALSGESVLKHYKLIRLIFKKAVQWGYLSVSPCAKITNDMLPKSDTKHYPILGDADLKRLLQIVDSHEETPDFVKNKLFFFICLMTGTRRAEAGALTWDAVDTVNCQLQVKQSLKIVDGRSISIGTPKTKKSVRTLFFDKNLAELFEKHKDNQKQWLAKNSITNPLNLVFVCSLPSAKGEATFFHPTSCYHWLRKLCKAHNLPHICLHSLRAQCATMAASYGTPINLVSSMLGHSNLSTTSIYVRDMENLRKKASNVMLEKFNNFRQESNVKPSE